MAKKKHPLISQYLAEIGRKGGQAKGKTKARDPEKMRQAALKRWKQVKKKGDAAD